MFAIWQTTQNHFIGKNYSSAVWAKKVDMLNS